MSISVNLQKRIHCMTKYIHVCTHTISNGYLNIENASRSPPALKDWCMDFLHRSLRSLAPSFCVHALVCLVCMLVCMHACMCVCMCALLFVHACVCVCVCVCVCACMSDARVHVCLCPHKCCVCAVCVCVFACFLLLRLRFSIAFAAFLFLLLFAAFRCCLLLFC